MPDNAIFYHAAYIAGGIVYAGYIVSLAIRVRRANERKRLQVANQGLPGRQ
jgi:hypothetical protein